MVCAQGVVLNEILKPFGYPVLKIFFCTAWMLCFIAITLKSTGHTQSASSPSIDE